MKQISATDLRDRPGEYLDRVNHSQETFIICRKHQPKAVLLSPRSYLHLVETIAALKNGEKPPAPETPGDEPVLSPEELKRLIA